MAIELKMKYGARMYYKYLADAFNQTIHKVSTLKGARAYASEMLEASFPYGLIELTK